MPVNTCSRRWRGMTDDGVAARIDVTSERTGTDTGRLRRYISGRGNLANTHSMIYGANLMADSQFARPELLSADCYHSQRDLLTRFRGTLCYVARCRGLQPGTGCCCTHSRWYGYIDYLARNMLPDMCDEDWLYRHARGLSVVP